MGGEVCAGRLEHNRAVPAPTIVLGCHGSSPCWLGSEQPVPDLEVLCTPMKKKACRLEDLCVWQGRRGGCERRPTSAPPSRRGRTARAGACDAKIPQTVLASRGSASAGAGRGGAGLPISGCK